MLDDDALISIPNLRIEALPRGDAELAALLRQRGFWPFAYYLRGAAGGSGTFVLRAERHDFFVTAPGEDIEGACHTKAGDFLYRLPAGPLTAASLDALLLAVGAHSVNPDFFGSGG